ncbi:MAG: fibronectin type III domain-containing protein [Lunatimonas sp.]|uniref:FN3 domain-containing metallophosphoesterase family protein n=1 Tax=Lunatimonas sp. TaxID=2060141 RepID=UPI00263AB61B|nr:FN3 domain-containing metallophosphoesterase family protein [Lunatimonas sp.]MCC5937093.1 fibronectin type III domain-containing protein [Lunatimonas sp.]
MAYRLPSFQKILSSAVTIIFLSIASSLAQQVIVQPFLQNASPSSMYITWETDSGEESIVEYGLSKNLDLHATGNLSHVAYENSFLHQVTLRNLRSATRYYYRVKTGGFISPVYEFVTPPDPEKDTLNPFRLLIFSDSQIDGQLPDKLEETVHQGILKYFNTSPENPLNNNLAMVLVTGDLVARGKIYEQWPQHFFRPTAPIFSHVPVYPVTGNHEDNSDYFFKYFRLPQNGNAAYDGHWWYTDYANVRVIGLDSNTPYRIKEQTDWLADVLEKTAEDTQIDFVFLQIHHPFKTEFWLVGELEYTRQVIELLEGFTEKSGKPSAHLFGHTHAYSRGQSRDHRHLWVNVASTSGRIDYWGEYAQRNYAEFSVSQPEYGFVVIEVDPKKQNPSFTLKRISRGNEYTFKDNELSDQVTVWRYGIHPDKPSTKGVVGNGVNGQLILKGSDFASKRQGAVHYASHWQIAATPDFKELLHESWKQAEDFFYNVNQQADDDLRDELVLRITGGSERYFRVRYRDQHLEWSDWSEPEKF